MLLLGEEVEVGLKAVVVVHQVGVKCLVLGTKFLYGELLLEEDTAGWEEGLGLLFGVLFTFLFFLLLGGFFLALTLSFALALTTFLTSAVTSLLLGALLTRARPLRFLLLLGLDLLSTLLLSVELLLLVEENVLDILAVDRCAVEDEPTVLAVWLAEAILYQLV